MTIPPFDVAIIGAGAAGLMCAAHAEGLWTVILEANARPGEKIRVSGGGKCNITNGDIAVSHYLGDPLFIRTVLDRFDNEALLAWLRAQGLSPVNRKHNQYFCPQSARELLDVLVPAARRHATLHTGTAVYRVERSDGVFVIATSRGTFTARTLLVASGGLSYPALGAGPVGHEIARAFGHTIVPPAPALVGMTLQKEQFWMKELAGVALPVVIRIGERFIRDDLLFAHRGISGPAVLDASLYWNKGTITVDFTAGADLAAAMAAAPGKQVSTVAALPKRFVKSFLAAIGVADKPCGTLTAAEKAAVLGMSAYTMAPAGTFGYTRAEATKGGVATDEVDPATMQSRRVPGLYFAGEVLDVTGEVGGYNFQWAFSSGYTAARAIGKG